MKVKSLSHVRLFATQWAVAYQTPPSMGFSRQEYWSGLPFPSAGDLPDPGIEPGSPALRADALPSEPPGKPMVRGRDFFFSLFALMEIAKLDRKKEQKKQKQGFFCLFILEDQIDLDVENTLVSLAWTAFFPSAKSCYFHQSEQVFLAPSLYFKLHLLHNNFSDSSPIYFMNFSCAQTQHTSAHLLAVFTVVSLRVEAKSWVSFMFIE